MMAVHKLATCVHVVVLPVDTQIDLTRVITEKWHFNILFILNITGNSFVWICRRRAERFLLVFSELKMAWRKCSAIMSVTVCW